MNTQEFIKKTGIARSEAKRKKTGPGTSTAPSTNTVQGIKQLHQLVGNHGVWQMLQRKEDNSTGMTDEVKQKMESAFETDFSGVRIHKSSTLANDVGALAYAQGNDIHFAPGQYNQSSATGQRILGHELAHVVQQRQGRVQPTTTVNGMQVNDSPALEHEADILGVRAAQMKMEATAQRLPEEEEELLQGKFTAQRMAPEEEEELFEG